MQCLSISEEGQEFDRHGSLGINAYLLPFKGKLSKLGTISGKKIIHSALRISLQN